MNTLLVNNGLIAKGEGLVWVNEGGQVGLGYRVQEFKRTVGKSDLDPKRHDVYIDQSFVDRGLGSIDTLPQLLVSDAKAFELPSGAISKYRPVYIKEVNTRKTFRVATKAGGQSPSPRIRPMIPCLDYDDSKDASKNDKDVICGEEEDRERPVYVVIPQ
jgi:hypothetical protein